MQPIMAFCERVQTAVSSLTDIMRVRRARSTEAFRKEKAGEA